MPAFAELATLADRCGLDVRLSEARDLRPEGTWAHPVTVLTVEGDAGSAMVRATGPEDAAALLEALRCVAPVLRHWTPDAPAVRDLAAVLEAAGLPGVKP